jgi:hypothetical protein
VMPPRAAPSGQAATGSVLSALGVMPLGRASSTSSSRCSGQGFSDCTSYDFELVEAEVLAAAAYTLGFEHTSVSANGAPSTLVVRATRVEGAALSRQCAAG